MADTSDRPLRRLATFAAGLLAVFAAAFGVGRATADGPAAEPDPHQVHAEAGR